MAKLKNPFSSLSASGRFTNVLTFMRRRRSNIAESTPQPKDAKSFYQLSWRHMYQKAVALWNALSAAEKQSWESLARPFHMTGFAYFISQALKPNPGLYLPLQGGTMAGDIDMDKNRLLKLPIPTDDQEAASKKYVDDSMPPGGYTEGARVYHNAHQSIPHNTWTVLSFNSERWDTDTIHDNAVNNSRLTCKTAGKYLVILNIAWDVSGVGERGLAIGSSVAGWNLLSHYLPVTIEHSARGGSVIMNLAVNEYLESWVRQTSGAALLLGYLPNYSPEFMMQRIG